MNSKKIHLKHLKYKETLTYSSLVVKMARCPPISLHLRVLLSQPSVSLLRKKQWSPTWTHPSGHSVQLIAVGWHGDRQIYKLNISRKVQNKKQALNYHSSAEHLVPGAEQLCARSEYWLYMCLKRSFKDSSFSLKRSALPLCCLRPEQIQH